MSRCTCKQRTMRATAPQRMGLATRAQVSGTGTVVVSLQATHDARHRPVHERAAVLVAPQSVSAGLVQQEVEQLQIHRLYGLREM